MIIPILKTIALCKWKIISKNAQEQQISPTQLTIYPLDTFM